MPTGPKHYMIVQDEVHGEGGAECRCMIGEDHHEGDDGPLSNYLSETEAEDIFDSSGRDEDYDFR